MNVNELAREFDRLWDSPCTDKESFWYSHPSSITMTLDRKKIKDFMQTQTDLEVLRGKVEELKRQSYNCSYEGFRNKASERFKERIAELNAEIERKTNG